MGFAEDLTMRLESIRRPLEECDANATIVSRASETRRFPQASLIESNNENQEELSGNTIVRWEHSTDGTTLLRGNDGGDESLAQQEALEREAEAIDLKLGQKVIPATTQGWKRFPSRQPSKMPWHHDISSEEYTARLVPMLAGKLDSCSYLL